MTMKTETMTDVTDRARAAGWGLPDGFTVRAWMEHDDDQGDPREKGEVYNTDVEEADYGNPTHGFCKHCARWIVKLDQAGADQVNQLHPADEDGQPVAVAGDCVARLATFRAPQTNASDVAGLVEARPAVALTPAGIRCPETGDPHELDDPVVVRWWREDRWEFVGVLVEVIDSDGRVWGETALWAVEAGTFPTDIDRDTGEITSAEIDPLTDPHHPLPDLINDALGQAGDALAAALAAAPVITPPPAPPPEGT